MPPNVSPELDSPDRFFRRSEVSFKRDKTERVNFAAYPSAHMHGKNSTVGPHKNLFVQYLFIYIRECPHYEYDALENVLQKGKEYAKWNTC